MPTNPYLSHPTWNLSHELSARVVCGEAVEKAFGDAHVGALHGVLEGGEEREEEELRPRMDARIRIEED
jgi:hypothetical protein